MGISRLAGLGELTDCWRTSRTTKMMIAMLVLLLLNLLPSTHAQQLCSEAPVVNVPGNLMLGGFFDIHDAGSEGKECGTAINSDAVQRMEAFLFTIDKLNSMDFVPGVTFGALVYDTCGSGGTAGKMALDYLARREATSHAGQGDQCNYWPAFVGAVGPQYSEVAVDVAALFTSAHVTQISYRARASELSNKDKYPYFLRVIPEGNTVAKVLIDILRELGWYDVAVVTGSDPDAADALAELHRLAGGEDICLMSVIKITDEKSSYDASVMELAKARQKGVHGVIVLTLPAVTENLFQTLKAHDALYSSTSSLHWLLAHPFRDNMKHREPNASRFISGLVAVEEYSGDVAEFRNYFLSIDPFTYSRNPWFQDYWEQVNNCTMFTTCTAASKTDHAQQYKQGTSVSQVIAAVSAYGYALKDAHTMLCSGGTSGTCEALGAITATDLSRFLQRVEFVNIDQEAISFNENGDLSGAKYSIMNVQKTGTSYNTQQVGIWTRAGGLDLSGQGSIQMYDVNGNQEMVPSLCTVECACANSRFDNSYGTHEPGDILVTGIFDIHGSGKFDKECDFTLIDPNAVQALEAFNFAIDQINRDGILPGIKLTGVAMDSCRNPARGVRQMKELLSRKIIIPGRNKEPLSPDFVIGGASSDVSMALAEFLASHNIPQISYGATNADLSDRRKYPYFLRTVGSDSAQARVIVDILLEFDWHHIAVIYSNKAYGKAAFREFMAIASTENICVSTQIPLEDYFARDNEAMNNIARYYIDGGLHNASVVVLLATDTDARQLLAAVQRHLAGKPNKLLWIASDYWGSRTQVVKDMEDVAEGAITIGFYSEEVSSFMNYYNNLKPGSNARNPWFGEYWQRHFECHIDKGLSLEYPNPCQTSLSLKTQNIKMADQVPYVIDAVYSAAMALHNLIIGHCGGITYPICSEARHKMTSLYDYLEISDFHNSLTGLNITFDVLGNGIPRYNIFNFRRDTTAILKYTKVGSWVDGKLDIKTQEVQAFPNSSGVPTPGIQVVSHCSDCRCTNSSISELPVQLRRERLTLLGYFPIHQRGETGALCQKYREDMGFLDFMAFKFAIEQVNNNSLLLPNMRLGYMAFDTCSDPTHAQTVFAASRDRSRLFTQRPQIPRLAFVTAFIGGYEEEVADGLSQMNYYGQKWVQITPGSRRLELGKYPFLLRSSSEEGAEARAMVAAVKALSWTYLSLVVSDSQQARAMEPYLRIALEERGVCVALSLSIREDPSGPEEYNDVIHALLAAKGAVGVLLLAETKGAINFLQMATYKDVVGRLVWLGFDMWTHDWGRIYPFLNLLKGALFVRPDGTRNAKFDSYMRQQNLLSDPNNPWFREFWQSHFRCNLDYNGGYNRPCTGKESLAGDVFGDRQSVISTINAVYSYAQGMTDLFEEECPNEMLPPCPSEMGENPAALTFDYIKNARVRTGADGKPFSYSSDGSGPGRYQILNVQIKDNASRVVQVGRWDAGRLYMNKSSVRMYDSSGSLANPISMCPGTCNCSQRQPLLDKKNVPVEFSAHREIWGVFVLTIALIGIIFSVIIMTFFIFMFEHPVVKTATCSLSVMLILGIILLYLMIFPFMISATNATCGIRRFGLGVFYALIFACLLVKTVRIKRITNKASLAGKVPFTSGPSQCCLAFFIVLIEVVIAVEWLVLEPPDVQWYLTNIKGEGEYPIYALSWRCKYSENALVTSLFYVFFLVLLTLIVSLKAINSLEVHREIVYIAMATFLTIIILVCWICVYTVADLIYQTPAICVGITANASVFLLFIFAPKMVLMTSPKAKAARGSANNGLDGEVAYSVPNRRGAERNPPDASIGHYYEETPPVHRRAHNSAHDGHVFAEHVPPGTPAMTRVRARPQASHGQAGREVSGLRPPPGSNQHIPNDVMSTAL